MTLSVGMYQFPMTLTLMFLQVTLTLSKSISQQEGETSNDNLRFGDPSAAGISTFRIGMDETEKLGQMAAIIESLEMLGVLDSKQTNCYSLDKIVKSLDGQGDQRSHRVEIYLHIRESGRSDQKEKDLTVKSRDSSSSTNQASTSDDSSSVAQPASLSSNGTTETDSLAEGCVNLTGTPIRLGVLGSNVPKTKMTSANSRTGEDSSRTKTHPKKHTRPKLSSTQILVIATCSTVIGLFFIVAVLLRIRNYIKRSREDLALQSRPTFRSCSVTLRDSQRGNNYTIASKSTDSGPAYKKVDEIEREADEEDTTAKTTNENRPLLIVTSASTPPSPIPTHREAQHPNKNECVKYIPNNHQSDYTNTVAMEDEDVTSHPAQTPDDDISVGTPGSQETLLDDDSSDENDDQHPTIGQESSQQTREQKYTYHPDLFTNCSQVEFEQMQRKNHEEWDPDINRTNDSDILQGIHFQTGVGFSQSDSSLTERNPAAYCYGNQVEYTTRLPGDEAEVSLRACSAPPTPEAVRRVIADISKCPEFARSTDYDAVHSDSDDTEEDEADDVTGSIDDVIPISAHSQSQPLYTQAQTCSFPHVTNSTNQPLITVQSPSGSTHVTYSATNPSPPPIKAQRNHFHRDENVYNCNDVFVTPVDQDASEESQSECDSDLESDVQSIKTKPLSIRNSTSDNSAASCQQRNCRGSPAKGDTVVGPQERASEQQEDEDSVVSDSEAEENSDSMTYGERSFLLDPAFEGMEPTFV